MGRSTEVAALGGFVEELRERADDAAISVGDLASALELVCAALSTLETAGAERVDLRDADAPHDPLFSTRSRLFGPVGVEPDGTLAGRLRRLADEVESLEGRSAAAVGDAG